MRVVVWQSAFLGDLVLSTNFLLNLFENLPSAEVVLVARPFAAQLLEDFHPNLRIVPLKKTLEGTREVIRTLKGSPLAFGLQRGARTSLSLFLAGIPERVGFDRAELSFLYTKRVKHRWGIHEVERNGELLRAVGLKIFTDRLRLPLKKKNLSKVKEKFSLPEEFAVVAPSANFEPKRWSSSHFAELIDLFLKEGIKVVLTGGPSDGEVAKKVLSKVKNPKSVLNLVGRTSVDELVHIIALAKLVVANDSAPVHIAEAVGTKAITIYCATSPYYGFFPRKGLYFEPKNLDCHPCKPNPKRCKKGFAECRRAVKPSEVWRQVEPYLEK